jgi:hypothetical protein
VHHGDLWHTRHLLPPAAARRLAAVQVDRGARIIPRVDGKASLVGKLVRLSGREPDRLMGADHGRETLPHMHLDVAVDQEVTPQPILRRVGKPAVWTLMVLDVIGQQQDRRGYRLDDKRLGGLTLRTSMVWPAKSQRWP